MTIKINFIYKPDTNWTWDSLPEYWQEEIIWLQGITSPKGDWDWKAFHPDWMEETAQMLDWRQWWTTGDSDLHGWPINWQTFQWGSPFTKPLDRFSLTECVESWEEDLPDY